MRTFLILSSFLILVSSFRASGQTVGQYEVRKRTSSGFTSYGITLTDGQVIGQTASVPAAITPLTANQTITLSGDITGSGSTAITATIGAGKVTSAMIASSAVSLGGNGAADSTKLAQYGVSGELTSIGLVIKGNGYSVSLLPNPAQAAGAIFYLPLNGGTIVTTGDTGTVTSSMLAGSIANAKLANSAITIAGTSTSLGGSITASAILDSISSTRGSILYRGATGWAALSPGTSGYVLQSAGAGADPTWAASGSGLTIGTSVVSGASANDLLISNGTVLQKITPGTGVASALANAVNGASGFLTYSIIGTSGATVPLLNTANTFSAAQTITGGTVTASTPLLTTTQTWNSSGVTFVGEDRTFTKTAAATNSLMARWSTGSRGTVAFAEHGEIAITSGGSSPSFSGNQGICGAAGTAMNVGATSGGWVYLGNLTQTGADMLIGAGRAVIRNGIYLGISSDDTSYGTADVRLYRDAAATLQLGADAATTTTQTLKSHDGSGTDKAGADLQLAGGQSTGTGTPGNVIFRTATAAGSSGSSANAYTTRMTVSPSGVTIGSTGTAVKTLKHGSAVLVAGTVTVSDADVVATSRILVTRMTDGGTIGCSYSITRSAGTSFTITSKDSTGSTQTSDTSTVSYLLINP